MWLHHRELPCQELYSLGIGTVVHRLLQANVSFVVSVRQSVRMEPLGSHCTAVHEILYLRIF